MRKLVYSFGSSVVLFLLFHFVFNMMLQVAITASVIINKASYSKC